MRAGVQFPADYGYVYLVPSATFDGFKVGYTRSSNPAYRMVELYETWGDLDTANAWLLHTPDALAVERAFHRSLAYARAFRDGDGREGSTEWFHVSAWLLAMRVARHFARDPDRTLRPLGRIPYCVASGRPPIMRPQLRRIFELLCKHLVARFEETAQKHSGAIVRTVRVGRAR